MSDSVSKYFEKLEDQEWWENKRKEEEKNKNKSRFARIKHFFSKMFNYGKN